MQAGVSMERSSLSERTRIFGTIPRGQGPKPTRLDAVDNRKEYDLISFRDEVAEIFRFCPCIYSVAKRVQTFTFPPEEKERTGADGISYRDSMGIGINSGIMGNKNGDVWKMAYIHELAHFLSPGEGHSLAFHRLLDSMLDLYNQETGAKLKNNYYGLKGVEVCRDIS